VSAVLRASALDPKREFIKAVQGMHRHHPWQVFQDFCAMSAIALYNHSVSFSDDREAEYMRIVSRYDKTEANTLARLLSITVLALEAGPRDFLGEVFMELDLGNYWKGQFFTPFPLCKMMAMMLAGDLEPFRQGRLCRVSEPACGAGAMILALAEHMEQEGVPLSRLRVHATDVDSTAAHMAYIQFSLLGIPALVTIGNTLTLEVSDSMPTPAWVAFASSDPVEASGIEAEGIPEEAPEGLPVDLDFGQLDLFSLAE